MDQDSTNSGERRNWRERLGIAKDNSKELPKISEEFRSESGGQPGEPRLVVGQSSAPSVKAAASDTPTAPAPAPRGQGATPVRPAPMAPRPTAATGAGRATQNQHAGNPVSPQTARPPSGQAKPTAVPSARAAAPQAAARAASTAAPAAAANGSAGPASDDFAERLRQQREAAERLARQRAATARVQNGAPPPLAKAPDAAPAPPRFSFAPDELAGDAKPAPAPVAAAPKPPQRPPAQNGGQQGWPPPFPAAPGPSPYAPPRSPGYPYGQQPYQPQRASASAYARPPQQGQAAAQQQAQAPYGAAAYGQEAWNGAETVARSAPARAPVPQRAESYAAQPELAYGNAAEDVYADQSRPRRPMPVPVAPRTPAVRPRLSEPEEQEQDDVYETDRRSDRAPGGRQQRAQVADYNNAYREYDEDYVEEEPRSRSGPLILLLALLALAVIVGVLIFFYTQNFNLPSSSAAANHEIPVIAPSDGPAKATPEPQVDTATAAPGPAPASSAPQPTQGRKQIYDRILGEEAVEQNKLVPTEEQPVPPPHGGDGQESGQTGTGAGGGGAPLPEPGADSGAPAQPHGHDSTAPEPLPLPPPPGVQGSNGPPAPADGAEAMASSPELQPDGSAKSDDTLIEPTSEQSEGDQSDLVKPVSSRPQPEPAKTAAVDDAPAAKGTSSETGTSSQGSVGAVAQGAAPSGTAKAKAPRAAKAGTAVPPAQNEAAESETIVDTLPPPPGAVAGQPASLGAPVRLGQSGQPVSPAGSAYSGQAAVPQGGNQPAYFDQFQRQAQQAASAGQRPQRTGRDVDPLDGLRTPLSGRSSVPAPPQQQLAMAEPPSGALPPAAPPPASFTGQQAPPAQAVQAPAPAARVQQPSAARITPPPAARITPPPAPAARPQQQAALIPATAPAVSGGTGYVVQLASFRSEAEAAGEFRRLQSRHPQLVGTLQQRIQRADLGASGTFYRLGVGPLGSKDQASRLCNSLIAAGEKDCLVRRQ
jgi:sporulation related protein